MHRPPETEVRLDVANYAVCFIDLLGQRVALRGQGLLAESKTEQDHEQLLRTLRASVGSISALQRHAEDLIDASTPRADSPLRAKLPQEQQSAWDELQKLKLTTQRWSDGLMLFSSLGDKSVKCHMNSVYRLFVLAAALCFIGLASKRPLRGAIEVAWGVELNPGELHGAAVSCAYELESEFADYPRIVVGPNMLQYIKLQSKNPGTEHHDQVGKALAEFCLDLIVQDADGHWMLHYLGDTYANAITGSHHDDLYRKAKAYLLAQLEQHRNSKCTKLAFRYIHLANYFDAHAPGMGSNGV